MSAAYRMKTEEFWKDYTSQLLQDNDCKTEKKKKKGQNYKIRNQKTTSEARFKMF